MDETFESGYHWDRKQSIILCMDSDPNPVIFIWRFVVYEIAMYYYHSPGVRTVMPTTLVMSPVSVLCTSLML